MLLIVTSFCSSLFFTIEFDTYCNLALALAHRPTRATLPNRPGADHQQGCNPCEGGPERSRIPHAATRARQEVMHVKIEETPQPVDWDQPQLASGYSNYLQRQVVANGGYRNARELLSDHDRETSTLTALLAHPLTRFLRFSALAPISRMPPRAGDPWSFGKDGLMHVLGLLSPLQEPYPGLGTHLHHDLEQPFSHQHLLVGTDTIWPTTSLFEANR
jgi:hypothetical protein